ncbi:hypothetical protein R1T16_09380 [Flavobacterium sp. DG1-102-2]|uniref:hypothetical protein n=1 Tax=Flavobacterium sp. DG1-102-2 TaxID=3081663 RepID=UPI00294A5AFB|nr:hypothetical protein [Flavobacterium sp. DG1-102-2]MDV6168634.1 hypothetical protein [Flavobacterium sp. DG1-102-2]
MKYIVLIIVSLLGLTAKAQLPGGNAMHCGYDFTSYVVLDVHESGKKENIKNLKITVVDSLGRDLVNVGNLYSFKNANQPMVFSFNYLIGDDNKKLEEGAVAKKERYFFPFAKDNYLLSVSNTFDADKFSVKIEDTDGAANGGKFKTLTLPLYKYNMYVLCSNESQQAAIKFGRKMNKPVDIVLELDK